MKKILFYWPSLNRHKKNKFDTNDISSSEQGNTTVKWNIYHVIYSKKWLMDDLFSEVQFEIVEDISKCKNCEIILVIHNLAEKLQFHEYENICSNNKVYLVHIGDEIFDQLDMSINIYNKSFYVFRPYFFKSNLKNIMHIPVGYKASNNFYMEKKKYFWSFCGTVYKSSRHDMIEVFTKNFDNYFLHLTNFFSDKKGLDADEMYKNISSSIFSLCPNGFYHPETYRVFEVLENNSIPIIQNPYSIYDKLFPNNNLIKINVWSDFLKIAKNINHEELLKSNLDWYANYKKELKLKIKKIIYG